MHMTITHYKINQLLNYRAGDRGEENLLVAPAEEEGSRKSKDKAFERYLLGDLERWLVEPCPTVDNELIAPPEICIIC